MASYAVKVAGSVGRGDNLESDGTDSTTEDQFGNALITGSIADISGAADTWLYNGRVLDLDIPSGFALDINDNRVNPVELLEYYGRRLKLTSPTDVAYENINQYQFTAEGRVFKVSGDTGEANDSITRNTDGTYTAVGKAGNGLSDEYWVLGGIDKSRTSIDESQWSLQYAGSSTTVQGLPEAGDFSMVNEAPNIGDWVVNGQQVTSPITKQTDEQFTVSTTGISDPDGDFQGPLEWRATNGQTGTGPDFTVSFAQAGGHAVQVTAYDSVGNSSSKQLDVNVEAANTAPSVSITNTSITDLSVTASASVSDAENNVTSITWNMGDGTTYSGQSVSHTYSTGGSYTIQVSVQDAGGLSDSDQTVVSVSEPVTDNPPTAEISSLSVTDTDSELETVTGDASGSRDDHGITRYEWNVGGRVYSGVGFQDTFAPGSYTATLKVFDASGQSDSTQQTFTVPSDDTTTQPGGTDLGTALLGAAALGFVITRNTDDN